MNKRLRFFIIIFMLFVLLLSTHSVYGVINENQKEVAEKFFKAFELNDYSLIEPHLTDLMKTAFKEDAFEKLRNDLVSSYGELKSYKFTKEEEKGKYRNYYYETAFEKKTITFIITMEDDKIAGIHFKFPFSFTTPYPLIGGLIGLLIIFLILRKFIWRDFIIGIGILLIILIVQPYVQKLISFKNPVVLSLWIGFIAALFQEIPKYYFSRKKKIINALYVGSGFGFGESLFIFLSALSAGTLSILSLIERLLAFFFHTGTTSLFSYAEKRGWGMKSLILMIILHTIIDSFAAYWNMNPQKTYIIYIIYAIMALFSLGILMKIIPLIKKGEETETP